METVKKTLVLIFPPQTLPTSPPLGIAMLKGYVERQLPDWEVKLLDLNLWVLNEMMSKLEAGTFGLPDEVYANLGGSKEELLHAAKVFRGIDNDIMLSHPDIYNQRGNVFSNFIEYTTKMFELFKHAYELKPTSKESQIILKLRWQNYTLTLKVKITVL